MEGRVTMDARSLLEALPDAAVGCIITDPPWDLPNSNGKFKECATYPLLSVREVADILSEGRRVLVPGGHLYCFASSSTTLPMVLETFGAKGWRFLRALAWDKGVHRGLGAYRNAWEPVLVFSNGASRGFQDRCKYPSLLKARSVGVRTAKPIELYRIFAAMSSRPGELVLDPFCGSNPLEAAVRHLEDRRWLAGDVMSPDDVDVQISGRQLVRKRGLRVIPGQSGLGHQSDNGRDD